MAPRKSAKTINARRKALEAAAAFQERENRLLGYAEDFFKIYETSGAATIEKKIDDAYQRIEELKAELAHIERTSETEQARVIARFKEEGVNNTEIASRLAISATDVRKLTKTTTKDAAPAVATAEDNSNYIDDDVADN